MNKCCTTRNDEYIVNIFRKSINIKKNCLFFRYLPTATVFFLTYWTFFDIWNVDLNIYECMYSKCIFFCDAEMLFIVTRVFHTIFLPESNLSRRSHAIRTYRDRNWTTTRRKGKPILLKIPIPKSSRSKATGRKTDRFYSSSDGF